MRWNIDMTVPRSPRVAELVHNQVSDAFVFQVSCRGNNQVVGCVKLLEEIQNLVAVSFPTVCFVPRIGRPSGWSFQKFCMKNFMNQIVRCPPPS
jgi:hypothetical protein